MSIQKTSSLFSLGRSAMFTQRQKMNTVQNNISNASTPGYRRKEAVLQTSSDGMGGVEVGNTRSRKAPFVQDQLTFWNDQAGFHEEKKKALEPIEASLNADGENILQGRVNEFFKKAQSLTASPGESVDRRDFLNRAKEMTTHFSRTRSTLSRQRETLRKQIGGKVEKINQRLNKIGQLNGQIDGAREGQNIGDVVDQRDQAVEKLSKQMGIDVVKKEDKTVQIVTKNGNSLVEGGTVHELEAKNPDASTMAIHIPDRPSDKPLDDSEIGGGLGGLVDAHNNTLSDQIRDLDQLAANFAKAFNEQHEQGYDANGNQVDGTPQQNFFTVNSSSASEYSVDPTDSAEVQGAAREIEVNQVIVDDPSKFAAADGGSPAEPEPGNNGNLQKLLDIREQKLGTGFSGPGKKLEDGLREINTTIGQAISTAKHEKETTGRMVEQLNSIETSQEGVSLEEEMMELNEAQRAFQAATKVMRSGEEMFKSLLSIKR